MSDELRPSRCPSCNSPQVAAILYGMPIFSDKLERELDSGRVVLGGCCVWDGMPKWQCVDCHEEWGAIAFAKDEEADA